LQRSQIIINKIKITNMKKNIKLNKLAQDAMKEKEMNLIRGGSAGDCCCGCHGPSGSFDNANANNAGGLKSPRCYVLKEIVVTP
jgi:natural product precursor